MTVGNTHIFRPNEQLSSLLGIRERDYIEGEYITNRPMKLLPRAKITTLYVYCNILEHVIVGDITAPLLRIIDVEPNSKKLQQNA